MATTYFEGIAVGRRSVLAALARVVEYIYDFDKTDNGRLAFGSGCSPPSAAEEMYLWQKEAEHATGRTVKDAPGGKKAYCAMWMRQSFAPGEVTPETALEVGKRFAQEVLGDRYQYLVTTHIDTHCIHNHILFNVIGSDYKKYHQTKYTPKEIARISDRLCREYGLSVVENPNPAIRQNRPLHAGPDRVNYSETLRKDIDRAAELARSWDEFLSLMEVDYVITTRNGALLYRHRTNGQQRAIRGARLGKGFSESRLKALIEPSPPAGKTYSAKLRGIKQMLQTMDTMDQYHIGSEQSYLESISQLREQEAETLAALRRARQSHDKEAAAGQLEQLEKIRGQRQKLVRMHGVVNQKQKGRDDLDR